MLSRTSKLLTMFVLLLNTHRHKYMRMSKFTCFTCVLLNIDRHLNMYAHVKVHSFTNRLPGVLASKHVSFTSGWWTNSQIDVQMFTTFKKHSSKAHGLALGPTPTFFETRAKTHISCYHVMLVLNTIPKLTKAIFQTPTNVSLANQN